MHSFSQKYIDDILDEFEDLRTYLISTCFSTNLHPFYSYFEKCCGSMLRILFASEQDIAIQKQYLAYFFNNLTQKLPLEEIIEYIDISRFKKILFL